MSKLSLPLSILAIVFSAFTFFYFSHSSPSSSLVYVDINKLLDGYEKTEIVRSEYLKKSSSLTSTVDSLLGDWQSELKIFEKERITMSKKELELKKELLSNKQNQINNYRQSIQQKLKEEDQLASQTVLNDINDFVKEYGEDNGYRIIFGATGSGTIMYASEDSDLTIDVLEALNKRFKGE